ncbi:unnamed protein product, partial [Discosporangium mesarthrocarpum]
RRILVPLCGKTVDMPFLAGKAGHEVVGVEGVEAAAWQLQRDSWLSFRTSELKVPPASSAADLAGARPGFIAASKFEGAKRGYVFKMGEEGLGYYLDTTVV